MCSDGHGVSPANHRHAAAPVVLSLADRAAIVQRLNGTTMTTVRRTTAIVQRFNGITTTVRRTTATVQ